MGNYIVSKNKRPCCICGKLTNRFERDCNDYICSLECEYILHTNVVNCLIENGLIVKDEIIRNPEELKTCGRCIHDGESGDIIGSTCHLCKRNPDDHRIDWFEERKG